MRKVKCLCTGFALVDESCGLWWPADLFQVGGPSGLYVVNGGQSEGFDPPVVGHTRTASFDSRGEYFERRGVFVFPPGELTFSAELHKYISEAP